MIEALKKILYIVLALILIIVGIVFLSDTEVSFSDKKISSTSKQISSSQTSSEVKSDSESDRWWEKTDKYAIFYGRVTQAHKDNGLHDRNRDKSIQMKKELCKIAATSTTGEGSFWIE
jgi:hypothetical protein